MRIKTSHLVSAALAVVGGAAHASLTLSGPENFQGTGLGAVNTILTIQSPANSTSETGQVAFSNGSDVITGDAMTGASQTRTRSFADLSVGSAADLRVVVNAQEPGNEAGNSITLSNLQLNVYNAAGTSTLFTASLDHSYSFADTFTGAGNSGFVFRLTDAEAAQLQAVFSPTSRVGLAATATAATGGPETFFVANSSSPVTPIPEPGTYALMLAGLGVVGFVAGRRKRWR